MYISMVNICTVEVAQEKAGSWVTIVQGMFGVGALTSPIVVNQIGISSFYVFSLISCLVGLSFLLKPSPIKSK